MRRIVFLAVLLAAASAHAESVAVVPAAAHAPGLAGTFFTTDLVLANPTGTSRQAELVFLPRDTDNTAAPVRASLEIPAGGVVEIPDAVSGLFGLSSAAGAILVRSDEPLLVTSRTANLDPAAANGGSFGQGLSAVSFDEALREGETAQLLGLRGDSGFRTNIGVAGLTADAALVTIRLFDAGRAALGSALSFTLQPYGSHQVNDVFAAAGVPTPPRGIRAEVTVAGAGRIAVYGSVVDGITGDPTTLVPAEAATAIPIVAHAAGSAGAFFRSDLDLWNPNDAHVAVTLRFAGSGAPSTASLTLAPGELRSIPDVLGTLFPGGTSGRLGIEADPPVFAFSRIYNDRAVANGGGIGTAGQEMGPAARLVPDGEANLVGLSRTARFRANLGLSNDGDLPATIVLELFSSAGSRVTSVDLEPGKTRQFVDVFTQLFGLPVGIDVRGTRIRLTLRAGDAVSAYGSAVDNVSGDPTTFPAPAIGPFSFACTAVPTSGPDPLPVAFSAVTEGAFGSSPVLWEFGDGATGAGNEVTHFYANPGAYSARATTTDALGRSSSCDIPVKVLESFDVSCTLQPGHGYAPLVVTVTAFATGGKPPIRFTWDFGDGLVGVGEYLEHRYHEPGNYDVVVTGTSAEGVTETCHRNVAVIECILPEVFLTVDPPSVCGGDPTTLFWWTSGATEVSIAPTVGTVAASGSVVVNPLSSTTYTLSAKNVCGTSTASVEVNVRPVPIIGAVSITPNPVPFGMTNAVLHLNVTGGGKTTITSSLGNVIQPSSFNGSGSFNLTYRATTAPGAETLTITSTNTCDSDVATFSFPVN